MFSISSKIKKVKADGDAASEEPAANLIPCPREGCDRTLKSRHGLTFHLKRHSYLDANGGRPGKVCHLCGKYIKKDLKQHLKFHE